MSETAIEQTIPVVDPTPPAAPPAPASDPDRFFTAADIERARQQEKDKLYGRLGSIQEKLEALESERQQRLEAENAARAEAEAAAEAQRQAELSLAERLEEQRREFDAQLAAERNERETALAVLQREREFNALEQHRMQALSANADDILPELADLVRGSTPDEIDASIESLKQRSAAILANTAEALQGQRRAAPGARVTAPPVGPLEAEAATRQLSAADIANMSMDEYMRYRSQFGVTGGSSHRGLFG